MNCKKRDLVLSFPIQFIGTVKLFLIFLHYSALLSAQIIDVEVTGFNNSKASLYSMEIGRYNYITSVTSNNNGQFLIFTDKLNLHTGLYRLIFENKSWLNFIFDGKEIKIKSDKANLIRNLKIIKSGSNKIYNSFLSQHNFYITELNKFFNMSNGFSEDNKKIKKQKEKLNNIQNRYQALISSISSTEANSFIYSYIHSARLPAINFNLTATEIKRYLVNNYFDKTDFSDGVLINSDVFINKTLEYLGYFANKTLSRENQEKKYFDAIDGLLNKAKVNHLVYQDLSEYLMFGFKNQGFDNVVDYIIENYVIPDDLCLDEQTDDFIKIRIDQSKYFKKGVTVPNIILPDKSGNKINLHNIKVKNKLILFYSSHCQRCRELLPELQKLYSQQRNKQFEVFAISLDTDRSEWHDYITNNNLTWINVSDMNGWKSKISFDYYVYATPTMFLVDKNNKLIGKPKSITELIKMLTTN